MNIMTENSTNLSLALVAVLETIRKNPFNQQIIYDYFNMFKDDDIHNKNLEVKEIYLFSIYGSTTRD